MLRQVQPGRGDTGETETMYNQQITTEMADAFAVYKYWFCIFRKKVSGYMLYGDALMLLWKYREAPHKWFITYYIHKVFPK
jgi:hypothetical protein